MRDSNNRDRVTAADLSIVIVNWNTKEMLANCLRSIEETRDGLILEIFVVDNASRDGSEEMVAQLFPEVRLIQSGRNLGFAKANNLALAQVIAPAVLFLNPDTVVKEGTLQAMVNILMQGVNIAGVGCKIRDEYGVIQELPSQWWITPIRKSIELFFLSEHTIHITRYIIPRHNPEKSGSVSYLYGACLMVKKEVLDKVGWFDDRFFMYCEDVDLCHRIITSGWKIFYLADSEILHLIGGATNNASGNFGNLMMLESIRKLMDKYYGIKGRLLFVISVFLNAHIRLLLLTIYMTTRKVTWNADNNNYISSYNKYIGAIKWCVNIQRPLHKVVTSI